MKTIPQRSSAMDLISLIYIYYNEKSTLKTIVWNKTEFDLQRQVIGTTSSGKNS